MVIVYKNVEYRSLKALCEMRGLNVNHVRGRMSNHGMTMEEAIDAIKTGKSPLDYHQSAGAVRIQQNKARNGKAKLQCFAQCRARTNAK